MEKEERRKKPFIAYEYKEVTTDSSMASFYLDGYENFGWEPDENMMHGSESGTGKPGTSPDQKITLHLKRDRKIINKAELTRLQRHFEACVSELGTLEKEKTTRAVIYALTLGIIGTAFMAGSVFAVTAQPPIIALCILLAIPGFLGWIFPYFVYRKVVRKETEKINPLIEKKYDEIYEICEKGNKLLN